MIGKLINLYVAISIVSYGSRQNGNQTNTQYSSRLQDRKQQQQVIEDSFESNKTSSQPKVPGIIIKITQGYYQEVKTLLEKQKYNVQMKTYQFTGGQWWYNIIITYGHLIIMYIMMNKFQGNQQGNNKYKIIIIGLIFFVGWIFISPNLKIQRIQIQNNNQVLYVKDQIINHEIIQTIGDNIDLNDINSFDF